MLKTTKPYTKIGMLLFNYLLKSTQLQRARQDYRRNTLTDRLVIGQQVNFMLRQYGGYQIKEIERRESIQVVTFSCYG